ncbi:MAG: hypothetical protein V1664_04930 [Candidatus Uhrbacteria bacterium]
MSKTPNYDTKIKIILDSLQPGERTCPVTGEKWTVTEEEIGWYKHFNVPPSDILPLARRHWLNGFNAGLNIWWNKHALTGERLLSYIHPDNKIRPIPDKEWHTYDWGEKFFGQSESEKPFLPQMRELVFKIPSPSLRIFGEAKNSIGVGIVSAEDCFMVFGGIINVKRCRYDYVVKDSEEVMDSYTTRFSNESLALAECERLFNCVGAIQCFDCHACSFIFDCRNCESCFLSTNLRNKKYVFKNEQLTKEQYEEKMKAIDLGSYRVYKSLWQDFILMLGERSIWPENFNTNCENCAGESLRKCLRCCDCYSSTEATDCYQGLMTQAGAEQCAYFSGLVKVGEAYMCSGVTNSQQVKFSCSLTQCFNLEYCTVCYNCENCFGCVGLVNKKFCILNKQYTEEDYWAEIDKIKCAMLERGEYGRFLPGDFSPAGIEFSADIYFDYTPEELKYFEAASFDPCHGAVVSEIATTETISIKPEDLPDSIDDTDETKHIGQAIYDANLQRLFSIRKEDYEFYRRHHLPLPREHFISRVKKIARMCNVTFTRHQIKCAKCQAEIWVADNPTFKDHKIYCQTCYLKFLEENN